MDRQMHCIFLHSHKTRNQPSILPLYSLLLYCYCTMVDLLLSSLSTHDRADEKWSDILSTISPMTLCLLLYILRFIYFNRHIFLENVAVQCFIFSLCLLWRGGYHIIGWRAFVLQRHSRIVLVVYTARQRDLAERYTWYVSCNDVLLYTMCSVAMISKSMYRSRRSAQN